jgi:pimeloyl-ACP methyl ester carboxylesterase
VSRSLLRTASSIALLFACGFAQAAPTAVCHLPGHAEPLQCASIDVPLDPERPDGATLPLHVTIAPAVRERADADPLYVLAGGPGQAGSDIVFLLDRAFARVRATRDIVLIDQRGSGRSGRLGCDDPVLLDFPDDDTMRERMAACVAAFDDRLLVHYSTDAAAADIEQVRRALGHGRINVWGGSYGTRLAQAYARRHPQSVRTLLLDSVAAPEQVIGLLGDDPQRALDASFARCAADAACAARFPDLATRFEALAERVRRDGVDLSLRHPRSAEPIRLRLSPARFVETIRAALYSPQYAARLPFVLDRAETGDWQPFAALLSVQADGGGDAMAFGLTLAVLCAEDIAHASAGDIDDDVLRSFLRGSFMQTFVDGCPLIGSPLGARPRLDPIEVPVLLLSGALDPVTPPSRAESAARHMARPQHLVAAHAGHGVSHLGCAPRLLRQFLDAPDAALDGRCLDAIPLPSPMLGPAGPQP